MDKQVSVMSNFVAVEFRGGQDGRLEIYISDPDAPKPLHTISADSLRRCGRFPIAARVIGEAVAMLMPGVRELFPEPLFTEEEARARENGYRS